MRPADIRSAKPHSEAASVTRKNTAEAKKPSTVVANDPADMKGTHKLIGGSRSDHWNQTRRCKRFG
jgi:hypothetical protein